MGDATVILTVGFVLSFCAYHPATEFTTISRWCRSILGLPLLDTVWVMTRRVFMGPCGRPQPCTPGYLDPAEHQLYGGGQIHGLTLFWACWYNLLRSE
jgi:UDP-N-acetylmuramyl pentapeptide phosphotransferase/UDP-N-acetylglucosamine-1-phosphate transferase